MKQWNGRITKASTVLLVVAGILYGAIFSPVAFTSHTIERGTIVVEVKYV